MNSAALEPVPWKARHWLPLLGFIFAAQLFAIYLLSAHRKTSTPSPLPQPSPSIRLVTGPANPLKLSETFLASDPMLFAAANREGFSGAAWLKIPKRNYDISERVETPYWLSLDATQLAGGIGQFVRTNVIAPIQIAQNIAPRISASPALDLARNAQTQSRLRIEGDLASRQVIDFPALKSWASSEILSNTVSQIAVNQRGTVVAVRLLARSGLPDADRFALEASREIRFAPDRQTEATWGNLIFDWHTLATTNAANESPAAK